MLCLLRRLSCWICIFNFFHFLFLCRHLCCLATAPTSSHLQRLSSKRFFHTLSKKYRLSESHLRILKDYRFYDNVDRFFTVQTQGFQILFAATADNFSISKFSASLGVFCLLLKVKKSVKLKLPTCAAFHYNPPRKQVQEDEAGHISSIRWAIDSTTLVANKKTASNEIYCLGFNLSEVAFCWDIVSRKVWKLLCG